MGELRGHSDSPDRDPDKPEGRPRPEDRKHLTNKPVEWVRWEDLFDDDDEAPQPPELEELTEPRESASRAERLRRGFAEHGADIADGLKDTINNVGDVADRPPTRASVGEPPKGPIYKAPDTQYGWGDSLVGLVTLAVVSIDGAQRAIHRWKDFMRGDPPHAGNG